MNLPLSPSDTYQCISMKWVGTILRRCYLILRSGAIMGACHRALCWEKEWHFDVLQQSCNKLHGWYMVWIAQFFLLICSIEVWLGQSGMVVEMCCICECVFYFIPPSSHSEICQLLPFRDLRTGFPDVWTTNRATDTAAMQADGGDGLICVLCGVKSIHPHFVGNLKITIVLKCIPPHICGNKDCL